MEEIGPGWGVVPWIHHLYRFVNGPSVLILYQNIVGTKLKRFCSNCLWFDRATCVALRTVNGIFFFWTWRTRVQNNASHYINSVVHSQPLHVHSSLWALVSKISLQQECIPVAVADPGFSKWGGAVLSQMGGRTSCFQVKSAWNWKK